MANIRLCVVFVLLLATLAVASQGNVRASVRNNFTPLSVQSRSGLQIPLTRLTKTVLSGTHVVYSLGQRPIDKQILAQKQISLRDRTDYQILLEYTGPTVDYVEISVRQSYGSPGEAYVVSGGVGQRQVAIIVEARNTWGVNVSASYYRALW